MYQYIWTCENLDTVWILFILCRKIARFFGVSIDKVQSKFEGKIDSRVDLKVVIIYLLFINIIIIIISNY